ncbi:NlpC/P60 family protein [Paenibacillus xerothermodurans]|uniref:NlpC/P60 family protein n=2 Tax=Paenibacillus xerothermodurans TaxID=1977292 RepID=A0A2W1NWY1_PAEXE|nr:NlpC/P60 family protein [Paenibacillus xerothermodurans]
MPAGTKLIIPTISVPPVPGRASKPGKVVKIKQHRELARIIISVGVRLRGTPYRLGAGPYPRSRAFDCSSFVRYVFGRCGIALPRSSRQQAAMGRFVRQSAVQPGDLVFFRRDGCSGNGIGHAGVDIGKGYMLHTYASPAGVTITRWRSPYWLRRYVTARRIL